MFWQAGWPLREAGGCSVAYLDEEVVIYCSFLLNI